MKLYVKADSAGLKLGPRQYKEFKHLLERYNSLNINETLYTSATLGRFLDNYFRNNGLHYGEDYISLPYQEGSIVKLSDSRI